MYKQNLIVKSRIAELLPKNVQLFLNNLSLVWHTELPQRKQDSPSFPD